MSSKPAKVIGGIVLGAGAAVGAGVGLIKGLHKAIQNNNSTMPLYGIICPMEEEMAPFLEAMDVRQTSVISGLTFTEGSLCGQSVVLVQCGVGKVNAAVCAQALCSHFPIDALINVGVAGTTQADIHQGDLVASTDAVQHDFDITVRGFAPGEIPDLPEWDFKASTALLDLAARAYELCKDDMDGAAFHVGRIASGDQFIAGGPRADAIHNTFDPAAVEMEGAAVAQAAALNDVPFLILRAISDNADADAPTLTYDEFLPLAIRHSFTLVCKMLTLIKENDKLSLG
jgi:adenosylhomocysteine nucleosidase